MQCELSNRLLLLLWLLLLPALLSACACALQRCLLNLL